MDITTLTIGLLLPLFGTMLGSAFFFLMKDEMSERLQKSLLGFASGVMVAASVWSLLIPAMEMSAPSQPAARGEALMSVVPAAVGFLLGMGFLLLIDELTPHLHIGTDKPEGPRSHLSRTAMPELTTASHKKVRFPKVQTFDMQMEHRATRLDLDFNFHVSNRSYVSIALLTMPDEVLSSQALTSLVVHWLHETYLDDTLTCRMSQTEDGHYLHTLTNAEGTVVCELMSQWQRQAETADVSEVLNRNL